MREILFRGKRVDNGEWVEGFVVKRVHNEGEFLGGKIKREMIKVDYYIFPEIEDCCYKIIPETLCEFTGLHDKNGKRIWENDIVKAPIYYDVGCYPYTETKIVKVQIPNIYRMSIDGDFEVIGNSIDNPELLAQKG